jgi:hypothetical protein
MDRAWFVDDSTLLQAGANSTAALQRVVENTGTKGYFLGLERRAKKCLWTKLRWRDGELARAARGDGEQLLGKCWLACMLAFAGCGSS